MKLQTNKSQRGIALGPILFIIAVLAILAAAIAAGSGGFSANTKTESSKMMAQTVINSCGAFQDAFNLLLSHGCDPSAIDWRPNGGSYPAGVTWTGGDFTGGNGTNQAGNGQCALYDPRGGGMIFKPLPTAALASPTTGAYTGVWGSPTSTNIDLLAGYPDIQGDYCISNFGTCPNASTRQAALVLKYYYLSYSTCTQINSLLKNPLNVLAASGGGDQLALGDYSQSMWANYNLQSTPASVGGGGFSQTVSEGCAQDYYSRFGSYVTFVFMCPLMIR